MLGKINRFHGYGVIKRLYKNSVNVRGNNIGLRYSKSHPSQKYRVAVVIGKKVNKSAVKRNIIRRRIYEVVRLSKDIKDGYDYVFSVFSDKIINLSTEQLTTEINDLLKKVKL